MPTITITYEYVSTDDKELNQFKRDKLKYMETDDFKNRLRDIGNQVGATVTINNWKNNSKTKGK